MSMFEDHSHLGFINDRIKKAEKRLEQNPYDVEAWSIIVRDAQSKKIEDARPYYEKLITQFPSAGRYWKLYIEHEMKSRNYERVEKLFTRCLVKVLNIDLWRTYLCYVKETKGSLPSYRENMAQAYDFALEKMGMDIMSYPIWNDYITFLKNVEAVGSYAENQRITAVRKVYQRGIINPMTNIEQLWKDYVAYEQGINPIIADKMIQDRSRDYMNARRVAKEYEAVTRGLNRNAPSTPPQGLPEEIKQVDLWKKYIAWEKSNPLRTEDHAVLTKRVMFAYEQCLLCLGHHPDIWYEAALFLEQSSKLLNEKGDLAAGKMFSEEAAQIYDRATTTFLKTNMLLHFAYADFEEGRMKYDKVHQIYNKFIENPDIDPTLAFIQYMKFARRAEGINSARNIFRKTRENVRCRHHVKVAASWMEYYCSKDKNVAFKIFELGLKKYGDNPDYILAYIDYLSHLNDDNNTRVLFERVLSSGSLPPEKQVEIWNRFLEFESNVGDLQSILKVEKRRAAVLEQLKEFEGKETALLVDRYKFMDLYPCTPSELKSVGYKEIAKQHVSSLPSSMLAMKESLLDDERNKKPAYPEPDVLQMIPYKPRQICHNPDSLPAKPSTPIACPRSTVLKNVCVSPMRNAARIKVGISNFLMLVQKNSFVDKTMLIKDFIESGEAVMLITSPRRFGKSTNMNMIKTFLEIEVDHKGNKKILKDRANYNLFTNQLEDKSLQISNHKELIEQYLGQYPVIFVSFASIQGNNYNEIFNGVKSAINMTFKQHEYIINVLDDIVKNTNLTRLENKKAENFLNGFERIYSDNAQNTTKEDIIDSLKLLSEILYTHFQKKVYVLVDEYDTPIDTITRCGSAEDIVTVNDLIDVVLGTVLKDNDYLESGLMTGISVIAKNSGSTNLNNVAVHRFLDQHKYVQYYGFTNEEVSMLLDTDSLIEVLRTKMYNDLSISEAKPIIKEEVKSFYNGYLAINTDLQIYNPWSVMQCLKQGEIINYWTHTGSIEEIIRKLFQLCDVRKKFEVLVKDEGIPVQFQENPTISDIQILQNLLYCHAKDIKHSHINLFFSYIFEHGYLTPTKQDNPSTQNAIKHYKIPNQEITEEFTRYAIDFYVNTYKLNMDNFFGVVQALKSIVKNYDHQENLKLKVTDFKVALQKLCQSLDFSKMQYPTDGDHPNESLLHTIVGYIVIQSNANKFGSEVSYNTGIHQRRPDIVASYQDLGIIIELKFNASADIAVRQIQERDYNNFFSTTKNIKYILDMGINLSKNKEIEVKHELQPNNTHSGQGILSVCDLDYLTYHE